MISLFVTLFYNYDITLSIPQTVQIKFITKTLMVMTFHQVPLHLVHGSQFKALYVGEKRKHSTTLVL